MRRLLVVAISDTHGEHDKLTDILPAGDVLVCSGDFTNLGTIGEITRFNDWLGSLDFAHKLVIAGNHDLLFESNPSLAKGLLSNATYLCESGVDINGFTFWGSPWQPEFCNWAFNLPRGEELRKKWERIPKKVDVLLTHCPPYGISDGAPSANGGPVGCEDLLHAIEEREIGTHVFGHIHEGYGVRMLRTTHINASFMNGNLEPVNSPIRFTLMDDEAD